MKRTNRSLIVGLAALVAVAAACNEDSTAPGTQNLSPGEAAFLTVETDRLLDDALEDAFLTQEASSSVALQNGAALSSVPVTGTFSFERTRQCPAGGQIVVNGSGQYSYDREVGAGEWSVEGTKTIEDCAFVRDEVTYTVNGSLDFDAYRQKENRELVAWERNVVGSFTVETSDGRTKECDVDLHAVYDAETGSVHVTGEFCGHTVDRTWTRG